MKTLILATVLALTAVSGVVVAPQTAEAGLKMKCGWEYVYRYGYRKLKNGRLGYGYGFDRLFKCKHVWVCEPFNC